MTLDIIIIVFILFLTIKYYRKGLVYSVLNGFSNILSIFAGYIIAKRYANDFLTHNFFQKMQTYIADFITENINLHDILASINDSDSLSMVNSLLYNLTNEDLNILDGLNVNESIQFIQDKITGTITYGIAYFILFVFGFILTLMAFKLVIKFIRLTLSVTRLTFIDKLLGGIVGFLISTAIASLFVWTSFMLFPNTEIYQKDHLNNTYILKYIIDYTPDFIYNFIA